MNKMKFLINHLKKIQILFYILQLFSLFNKINCHNCQNVQNLQDTTCFNDVIKFDHDFWRAGHACTNKKGTVIVEFSINPSESSKRLFYGLNKKGRYYFPGEPVYKEIDSMTCQDCSDDKFRGRFESRNLLVHLNTDTNREKEYLFSMSSYYSLVELIDIDDRENFNYYAWDTLKFFELARPIFSYEYSLFEVGTDRTYISAFIESAGFFIDENDGNKEKEYSNTVNITLFKLTNFGSSDYREIIKSITLSDTYSGRVVSAFRLEDPGLIVLLFVTKDKTDTENKKISYIAYFYDDSLNYQDKQNTIYGDVKGLWMGFGIFVKGIALKGRYAVLAFFYDGDNKKSLDFKVVKYKDSYDFDYPYVKSFNDEEFRQDVQSNGLYKLNDERVVLFTTKDYNSKEYGSLNMFLFDFYNDYQKMKIRRYIFYYPEKRFAKEMDASIYNGYTLFTATLCSDNNQDDIFAIMMIFGFGNGTDHEIDISPYLMDTGFYNTANNLYDHLINNMTIDNNIFGYNKIEKIRLISICDELLLYKGKYGVSQEENVLPLNELFDADHVLYQNKSIKKEENKLYTLEYQYMVEEPDYDTFYSMPNTTETILKSGISDFNEKQYYHPKILDGRVNILKFKLCHTFCIDCIEFGRTDNNNDQRCLTCKEENTYDYLAATNNFTGNCVPYNYMYDAENKELKTCDDITKYKFYYNKTRNDKKYCFKYSYECPDVYHYLNLTSHECLDYTPIITTIPTTIPIPIITTIPEIIPTTIIPPIPTTIIPPEPSTIIPPEPSTIITKVPTTMNEHIPTTLIEKIQIIKTTIPIIPPQTTLPEIIPETIVQKKCKYGISINYTSSYSNLANEDIYYIAKEDIISSYCLNGSSVIIEGSRGYAFQVTNTMNEVRSREIGEISSIDITGCENILKNIYNIDPNLPLIIIKFLKDADNGEEQTFQYEVYHPITYQKLNLSHCDNTTSFVYVQKKLYNETKKLYDDLVNQGYDPLDINDKFYREICTPYTSENGTDVLLDDREEFIYSSLVNASLCPEGCGYTEYFSNKNYIKCECGYNNTDIVTLDIEHLSGTNAYKSFLSTMKSTNYKVMICYNLVFNFKIFCHNYGSILTLILFVVYCIFIIFYCIREISPIKVNVSKILFEERKNENKEKKENINQANYEKFGRKITGTETKIQMNEKEDLKGNYPPKKGKIRKSKQIINNLVTENIEFINEKPKQKTTKKEKNKKVTNRLKPSNHNLLNMEKKTEKTGIEKTKKIELVKNKQNKNTEIKKKKNLDNYELNNLEYAEACELDKRSFCTTYWSVLMREHLALVTFFAWKDYNLFYVKLDKFLILLCTDMTMNGLFFIHESMHKKYTVGEDFTFVQKIPQLLFTLVVAHILEVILCYLGMTDTHVYEIKELPNEKGKGEKIMDILDKIKRKLVAFFVFTFLLFLFYWYFISAFCAVYQNTQKIFLRDSLISCLTALIDPFLIYGFTTILRTISLCFCCRKRCYGGCLYKLSDLIPIF